MSNTNTTGDPEKAPPENGAGPSSSSAPSSPQPAMVTAPDEKARHEQDKVTPTVSNRPEREATFADYLRIFTYAKPLDFVLMALAALSSIGSGTTLPLMNVLFGRFINNFTAFDPRNPNLRSELEQSLNQISLYMFILFLVRFSLGYIQKFSLRMIGIRMSAAIRLDFLVALFGQTVHVLDSMPPGSAAGTITGTANTLQLGISEKLGNFVEFLTMIITAIIIAFTWSWLLTLVVSSIILFILLVVGTLLPFIIRLQSRQTKAETKATSVASESFGAIRMVTACGAEERIGLRYAEWVHKAKKFGQTMTPLLSLQFGLLFFAIYGAFALAFWYGTKMLVEGRIGSIGAVVIVLMSVILMVISLERVTTPLIAVTKAMVAAAEFFVVIDAPRPPLGTLKEPDVSSSEDIFFSGVDFAYPSRPHIKVLDDLTMSIPAGKVTAIVGPSGSGKSTIVGLIEKWYSLANDEYVMAKAIEKDKNKEALAKKKEKAAKKAAKEDAAKKGATNRVTAFFEDSDDEGGSGTPVDDAGPRVELKGSIKTSGHDLSDMDVKWWRSQIGMVQQEPFLFNDTIENNVMHGLVGSQFENESEERKKQLVREACAEAFADEFIDRLPDGYQTQVGDSGTKLSGGQRQRIAIARSIIKMPKILILDEATSAIDVRGEKIVQAALDKVSKGRTTITIAHRLSTIKTADKICVLQKGRCVEEGTHESLLADPEGVYSGLVRAQQLSLGDDHGGESDLAEESIGDVLAREKSAARSETAGAEFAPGWRKKGLIKSFGRLLLEQRSRWPVYGIALLAALVASAAVPIQAFLFGKIIVVFNLQGQELLDQGSFYSLMWFILAIAVGMGYFVLGFSAIHLQHYICATYRQQYFRSLLFQKIAYFDDENNATGSLTARVAGDPKQLEELLGMNMAMVCTAFFSLVGALAIAFAYAWKLTLVGLCVTVPLWIGGAYFRFKHELEFEKMYAEVFAESSKWAAESIGAFRTVASLTLEGVICDRYKELLAHHVTTADKKARFSTVLFALSESISLGCQALIFWYGGRLMLSGEYDTMQFFVCYMAIFQGAESAGNGLSFGPNAAQATAAANRILGTRESILKDAHSADETIPDTAGGVRIELEDVHFKYPTRNVSIFRGLNITIEKGQFAALVGASGSGKTSIISLLERFYDPHRGRILFNGVDITEVNVYEYRKLMSLVAQEATLFQGTIRDNILIGVDPAAVTEERLHQVCRDASIHDFIVSLPEGYDTDIGSKGVSLSGGQKQRVAIARALIRDPSVLLLDEATSALDSDTEKLIQATFERVSKGRTTVAVAHRLSTIQKADVIYVLGEGKVLEKGNHAELLKKRGVYWHMCHSQALDR